jgi:small-conductance mechanosensitive channel
MNSRPPFLGSRTSGTTSTAFVGAVMCALLAHVCASAQAQTPAGTGAVPAKAAPAPKPAAAAAAAPAATPATVGGKKIMSREELRACLKRNDDLKARSKDLDDQATAINAERPQIEQTLEAIRAERASLEARATRIREFQPKMVAYGQKVETFNRLMGELSGKTRMTTSEGRQLEELRKQIPALEAERKALNAEREQLLEGYEDAIKAFAVKAKAAEDRAAEWNQRKTRHTQDGEDMTAASADWRRDCADRPYREDDEKAIRAGK